MESIKEFLSISSGDGYGDGDGSGYGYGYGSGDGDGYGYGSGDGYGYGYGSGDGDGSGYGYGYGSGDGYGYGYGYGYGSGIKSFDHKTVYIIDGTATLIDSVRHGIAIGSILRSDLVLLPCVIVKSGNIFAHGETLRKAMSSLSDKLCQNMTEEERIAEFWKHHNRTDRYSGEDFFDWHHKLTGSCEMGRNAFVQSHHLNLEDTYTVQEFVDICKNDYGGSTIRKLIEGSEDLSY